MNWLWSGLVFVLLIVFVAGQQIQWPSQIPRCRAGDEECIPGSLTQLFRYSEEIPELKIPTMDPFVWNKTTLLRTRNPNSPISVIIRNTNTTIYGLKNMEVREVKGFGADPKNTKFEIKSFVPVLTSVANYKSTMKLFALPIMTEGVSNTTIKNVEIRQIIETKVIEKDGLEYLDIKKVRVTISLTNLNIRFNSKTGNEQINETINKVVNENWKDIYYELKPDLEKNIGEVIKSLIKPIFSELPYENFFLPQN